MCLDNRLKYILRRCLVDVYVSLDRLVVYFNNEKQILHASAVSEQVSDAFLLANKWVWEHLFTRSSSAARGDRGVGKRKIELVSRGVERESGAWNVRVYVVCEIIP